MVLLPWWPAWGESAVQYVSAVLSWALALYVGTRGGLRRIPLLATLSMLCLVAYELGLAVAAAAPDESGSSWLRATWWGPSFAPAFWLLLTLALAVEEGPEPVLPRLRRLFPPVAVTALGIAAVFAALGTFTDLLQQWPERYELVPVVRLGPETLRLTGRGPFFPAYQVYVVVSLAWGAFNVGALWFHSPRASPLRPQFGWLLASAALFLLAGVHFVIGTSELALPGLPGHLMLVLGMVLVGWNLVRYGALLAGEVVTSDVVAFGLSTLAVVLLYGLLMRVFVPFEYPWLERALPLLLVLMTSHALSDASSRVFDRFFYEPVARALRTRLRFLSDRVVRQPDPLTALADVRESIDSLVREQSAGIQAAPPEPVPANGRPSAGATAAPAEVRLLVEGALRHLNDLPGLSQHPLLDLVPSTGRAQGTALERATLLRAELEHAIERLRPPGLRPTPGSATGPGGWLHYLVLREAYVDGRPNKQIMQRYALSEGTFHRARRRAVDAVALDLYQRMQAERPAGASAEPALIRLDTTEDR